jgi:glycosyltransferase involved in cell wall biosynthesis
VYGPGEGREPVRRALGLDAAAPVVGVVGRLEAQKGHTYLLDAWPDVRRDFPGARLLVVGDGALRAELEARALGPGLHGSVTFTGFRADVPRVLAALDVLVLPSLYEGMPLTVIEASAMGLPVVATAVDGTPEVVRDGETGRLVPPARPAALADALRALLADPARARAMGRAGRAHVLARFDLDTQVEATARVYRRVAGALERVAA